MFHICCVLRQHFACQRKYCLDERQCLKYDRGSAAELDFCSDGAFAAVTAQLGGAASSVYSAIARLGEAEIIRPLTDRTRNQVWVAGALADELDDLGLRIATRARTGRAQT